MQRHGDLFAPEGSDEQWLEYCGTNGLVAITHDTRIRYRPNELDAVVRFNVQLVVVSGKWTAAELAHNFVNTMRRVEVLLAQYSAPLIVKVYRAAAAELRANPSASGRAEVWYPKG